jgi:hypothetical protein
VRAVSRVVRVHQIMAGSETWIALGLLAGWLVAWSTVCSSYACVMRYALCIPVWWRDVWCVEVVGWYNVCVVMCGCVVWLCCVLVRVCVWCELCVCCVCMCMFVVVCRV